MTSPFDDDPTYVPGAEGSSNKRDDSSASNLAQSFPLPISLRYRCIKRLGRGSSGMVYQAYDNQLQRDVAIKFIHQDSRQARKQLLAEGRLLAQLDHPNICQVYEVAEEGDAVYLVMSLIPGQHLHHWRAHFTTEQHVALIAQICDALAQAHDKGIVHCDIKPGNIVLREDSDPLQAVLVDFGISSSHHAATSSGAGTEHYMAPERLAAETPMSPNMDVYAIGATLRVLLTGHHDNRGLQKLPRDLRHIVENCLRKLPTERYQNAAHVALDLRAFLEQRPISLRHGVGYRLQRYWQRTPWFRGTALAAASTLLLLVLLAGLYQGQTRERQLQQLQLHQQVVSTSNTIDAIMRTPAHDARESLAELQQRAQQWAAQADEHPAWLAATYYASAGHIFTELGRYTDAHDSLVKAWQLGERSGKTAASLAITLYWLHFDARGQAHSLPTAEARSAAVAAANERYREPALDYLSKVEQSELPPDYLEALRLALNGQIDEAIRLLQQGNFPAWFYQRDELGTSLSSYRVSSTVYNRRDGDPVEFLQDLEHFSTRLLELTPSNSNVYTALLDIYALLIQLHPASGQDEGKAWAAAHTQLLDTLVTLDPSHPFYHTARAAMLANMLQSTVSSPEEGPKIIRQSIRHSELAIKEAYRRDYTPMQLALVYQVYFNRLRGLQSLATNFGLNPISIMHRAQTVANKIPPRYHSASYFINLARIHEHLALHTTASQSASHYEQQVDALYKALEIAPHRMAIIANVGIGLTQRSVPLQATDALATLDEALQHMETAYTQSPNQAGIAYNYALSEVHKLRRQHQMGNVDQGKANALYHDLQRWAEQFPQIEYFRHLLSDLMLYQQPEAFASLAPLEQVAALDALVDAVPNESSGFEWGRQMQMELLRWRVTGEQADLEALAASLETVLRENHANARYFALWITMLTQDLLFDRFEEQLHQVLEGFWHNPLQREFDDSYALFHAGIESLSQGAATEDLRQICARAVNTSPAERPAFSPPSHLQEALAAIEAHYNISCTHADARQSIFQLRQDPI